MTDATSALHHLVQTADPINGLNFRLASKVIYSNLNDRKNKTKKRIGRCCTASAAHPSSGFYLSLPIFCVSTLAVFPVTCGFLIIFKFVHGTLMLLSTSDVQSLLLMQYKKSQFDYNRQWT